MDGKTFDRIADLRAQAQKAASEHDPPSDQEHDGATPGERFRNLGQFVLDHDEFPLRREYGGRKFSVSARLPSGVLVNLIAETGTDEVRPSVDEVFAVRAAWGDIDHPLHVDSVANISDSRIPYDSDLRNLALVEESFAEAKPHLPAYSPSRLSSS